MRHFIAIISVVSLLVIGCGGGENLSEKFEAEGFTLKIEAYPGSMDRSDCSRLIREVGARFQETLGEILGQDGELAKLNRERGPLQVSPEFYNVLNDALTLEEATRNGWNYQFGGVYDLYAPDQENSPPLPSDIAIELDKAHDTKLVLMEGDRVSLEGEGTIRLSTFVLGWAIDQAADVLKGGGIKTCKLTTGMMSTFWGDTEKDTGWVFTIDRPDEKEYSYTLSPDDGSLCMIYISTANIENKTHQKYLILDPETGEPVNNLLFTAAWGSSSTTALAYAEALHVMGRPEGMEWVSNIDSVGAFVMFSSGEEKLVESDPTMSPWVEMYLP